MVKTIINRIMHISLQISICIADSTKTTERVATIAQGHDITERKRAEEERIKLERQLQQARKAESLGRMAGAIAHHFNNKLGAVMGNLELALRDAGANQKPIKPRYGRSYRISS
jgi:C4-dicarboxylate-specific signal transduction histidine kinase